MINNFFNKHSKSITAGITIILIIAFFIYLKPLLNLMSINSESLFAPYMSKIESIDNDSFLQIFTSNNHSWFLFSIAYVIISRYLPIWLNMHPQMCIAYVGSYILFILLTCLILSLAKSCTKYIKNKNIFPLIFLFGIMSFFPMLKSSDFMWVFKCDCWFLSYMFLPIFGILLLDKIQKKYVLSEEYSKKDIIILILLILCVAISHEFYRFIFLLTIFFLYIFEKEHKKANLKRNCIFILSYIALIIINLLTFLTKTYRIIVRERADFLSFNDLANNLPTFLKHYNNYIIQDNIWLFFAIIISFILIFQNKEIQEKNKKIFIWTISIILSIFIFALSLIFVQDDYDYLNTILQHNGLRFLIKITLYSTLMSLIGYFISFYNSTKKTLKIFISIILLLSSFILDTNKDTYNLNEQMIHSKIARKNAYVLEKIFSLNETDIFYNYFDKGVFTNIAPFYLNKVYNRTLNPHKYKVHNVCKNNTDNLNDCREKLMKIAEEKFNYKFTYEELEKLDFEKLRN